MYKPWCDYIYLHHKPNESTIVFSNWYYGARFRLAKGDPIVCTRKVHDQIFKVASEAGLEFPGKIFQFYGIGNPCWPHGIDVAAIEKRLEEKFPHYSITITNQFLGWFDCGHWEFVVVIKSNSEKPSEEAPVTQEMAQDCA